MTANHFLAIIYFALFGFVWPFYLSSRTRGALFLACWTAPIVEFYFGTVV